MGRTTPYTTIESSLDQFLNELDKRPSTIQTYRTDIQQFTWLHANDITIIGAQHVTNSHIDDYLRYLTDQGRTGTTCARKLISMHLFFTYLVSKGVIQCPPTAKVKKPRKERKPKYALRPDKFKRIVGAARGNPRDYALLQLLFQTGIRVSEVIAIRLSDLDMEHTTLTLHMKGGPGQKNSSGEKSAVCLAILSWCTSQIHQSVSLHKLPGSRPQYRREYEKWWRSMPDVLVLPKRSCSHSIYYTCSTHRASVLGRIDYYPKTPLRNERVKTPKKTMPLCSPRSFEN